MNKVVPQVHAGRSVLPTERSLANCVKFMFKVSFAAVGRVTDDEIKPTFFEDSGELTAPVKLGSFASFRCRGIVRRLNVCERFADQSMPCLEVGF